MTMSERVCCSTDRVIDPKDPAAVEHEPLQPEQTSEIFRHLGDAQIAGHVEHGQVSQAAERTARQSIVPEVAVVQVQVLQGGQIPKPNGQL